MLMKKYQREQGATDRAGADAPYAQHDAGAYRTPVRGRRYEQDKAKGPRHETHNRQRLVADHVDQRADCQDAYGAAEHQG